MYKPPYLFCLLLLIAIVGCKKEKLNTIDFDFNWSADPVVRSPILFSTNAPENSRFEWDFGDGFTSKIKNPQHIYEGGGTYKVSLTVNGNKTGMLTKDIFVKGVTNFTFGGTPLPGDTIFFFPNIPPYIQVAKYYWDFGDGQISTERFAKHVYAQPGRYNISLKINDSARIDGSPRNYIDILTDPKYLHKVKGNKQVRVQVLMDYFEMGKQDSSYIEENFKLQIFDYDK